MTDDRRQTTDEDAAENTQRNTHAAMSRIVQGDCLEVLPTLPRAKMIFADPPDNLGVEYDGFDDHWSGFGHYLQWLCKVVAAGFAKTDILWLSYNAKWDYEFTLRLADYETDGGLCLSRDLVFAKKRKFIWHYTFGQHNNSDCAPCYRPILRIMREHARLYPDAIRIESQRQRNGDKRANSIGRVPGDVWGFPRIVGNAKERRKWHPNQHPEELIERIVKFSCVPGDLVIDMFAGTGTTLRVCKRLGIDCIGIEISPAYCRLIGEEIVA